MKKVTGLVAVQCRWIPADSKEFRGKISNEEVDLMNLQSIKQSFTGSIIEKGMLEVIIV